MRGINDLPWLKLLPWILANIEFDEDFTLVLLWMIKES